MFGAIVPGVTRKQNGGYFGEGKSQISRNIESRRGTSLWGNSLLENLIRLLKRYQNGGEIKPSGTSGGEKDGRGRPQPELFFQKGIGDLIKPPDFPRAGKKKKKRNWKRGNFL